MPNWTSSRLTIEGNEQDIQTLVGFVASEGTVLDFNNIIPQPEYENDGDWYDWCCDCWGTKWNACDAEIYNREPGKVEYDYDVANGVASHIVETLAIKFPMLDFRYQGYETINHWSTEICFVQGEMVTLTITARDCDEDYNWYVTEITDCITDTTYITTEAERQAGIKASKDFNEIYNKLHNTLTKKGENGYDTLVSHKEVIEYMKKHHASIYYAFYGAGE